MGYTLEQATDTSDAVASDAATMQMDAESDVIVQYERIWRLWCSLQPETATVKFNRVLSTHKQHAAAKKALRRLPRFIRDHSWLDQQDYPL